MGWSDESEAEVERLWNDCGLTAGQIAKELGVTRNAILGKSRRLNLHYRRGNAIRLGMAHPAVSEGRTLFPARVTSRYVNVIKPGEYQRKLGHMVKKGRWRGYPIFSITLEERATCPRSCAVYAACYGNGMHQATRFQHGPEFEDAAYAELRQLQARFPHGFVVRLHILGDFYSVEYVKFWERSLNTFPGLNVFGYTAWQPDTPIGAAVTSLRDRRWQRFAVRTSGGTSGPRTHVIKSLAARNGSIACPAQLNRTSSCSTCALCWGTKKPIAFLEH